MDGIMNVTADRFEAEVVGSTLPVLAHFWVDCELCNNLTSHLASIVADYSGRLKFVQLDKADQAVKDLNEEHKLHLDALPVIALFKEGKIYRQKVFPGGVTTPDEIKQWVDLRLFPN